MNHLEEQLTEFITLAKDQGWEVTQTNSGHYRFLPPDKSLDAIITSSTPSDWRGLRNTRSRLRKAGLTFPQQKVHPHFRTEEANMNTALGNLNKEGVLFTHGLELMTAQTVIPLMPEITEVLSRWRGTAPVDSKIAKGALMVIHDDNWDLMPSREQRIRLDIQMNWAPEFPSRCRTCDFAGYDSYSLALHLIGNPDHRPTRLTPRDGEIVEEPEIVDDIDDLVLWRIIETLLPDPVKLTPKIVDAVNTWIAATVTMLEKIRT